jgi:hypothetical protein
VYTVGTTRPPTPFASKNKEQGWPPTEYTNALFASGGHHDLYCFRGDQATEVDIGNAKHLARALFQLLHVAFQKRGVASGRDVFLEHRGSANRAPRRAGRNAATQDLTLNDGWLFSVHFFEKE